MASAKPSPLVIVPGWGIASVKTNKKCVIQSNSLEITKYRITNKKFETNYTFINIIIKKNTTILLVT